MGSAKELDGQAGFNSVVAVSQAMRKAVDQARRAARVDGTVLLSGEPGTGKELLASLIHRSSRRREGPLVRFDATAVSIATMDDQLFGWVDDASDGQRVRCHGRFKEAAGGTLFINEVGALTPTSQARLLRALETGTVTPVGGCRETVVDVRIISATTRDLYEEVAQQRFRRDLFYRLNVIPIHLPPLRQRREDVPALVREFLHRVHAGRGMLPIEPEPQLLQTLASLDWPGNVRQLREFIEHLFASAKSPIPAVDDLLGLRGAKGGALATKAQPETGATLAEVEKETVLSALKDHQGNRTRAAESLGISVRTLQRKLQKWSHSRH